MASITTDLPSTHRLHTGSSPILLSKQLPSCCLTYYTDYCASYCRSYCLNCIPTIIHMKCYLSYCRYYRSYCRSYYWSFNSTHCRQNRLSDEPYNRGESELEARAQNREWIQSTEYKAVRCIKPRTQGRENKTNNTKTRGDARGAGNERKQSTKREEHKARCRNQSRENREDGDERPENNETVMRRVTRDDTYENRTRGRREHNTRAQNRHKTEHEVMSNTECITIGSG